MFSIRALVSRFEWLRHSAPPGLATPPIFMVFDCRISAVRRNVIEDVLDGEDRYRGGDRSSPMTRTLIAGRWYGSIKGADGGLATGNLIYP